MYRRQKPCCRGMICVFVALMLLLSLMASLSLIRSPALHGNDFKHLWLASRLLRLGENPYDSKTMLESAKRYHLGGINPYVYLPTTAMLMRPLGWTYYALAQREWFWVNFIAVWGIVLFGPCLFRMPYPDRARLIGSAFVAGSLPLFRQMTAGQMNVIMAWIILLAAWAFCRRHRYLTKTWSDGFTGGLIALGFAWKLIPIGLLPACAMMRRWCVVGWGCLAIIGIMICSLTLYGSKLHLDALKTFKMMRYGTSTWNQFGMDFYRDPFNQSIGSLMHHLLTSNPYTSAWVILPPWVANTLTFSLTLLLTAGWVWSAWRAQCRSTSQTLNLFFAAVTLMLLAPSLMWDHYMVQLLPILIWLAGTSHHYLEKMLLFISFALISLPIQHAQWNHGVWILGMSLRLWPTLLIYGMLLYRVHPKCLSHRPFKDELTHAA